jgi:hypothetical protein
MAENLADYRGGTESAAFRFWSNESVVVVRKPNSSTSRRTAGPRGTTGMPQPAAFMALVKGFDGECPCSRRPFADAQ